MERKNYDEGLAAISGGQPVGDSFLVFWQVLPGRDDKINEVIDTLRSTRISTGPKALRFEQMFAEQMNNRLALAVNSSTAALHYRAAHTQPFYHDTFRYKHEDFPIAAEHGGNIITIPLMPRRSARDVKDVMMAVRKVWRAYQRL